MPRYILLRLALAVPTLLAISFLVFFAAYLSPSDPVDIIVGERASPELKRRVRVTYGLDRPPLEQYGKYVLKIVTRGDFGRSFRTREPVVNTIKRGFPNTALLATLALLFALVVGVPLGILAATQPNRWPDRTAIGLSLIGVAVPSFVLGPLLLLILAVNNRWLPTQGFSLLEGGRMAAKYFTLPVLALGARSAALIARMTRSAMLDTLQQDYIRTARAKGVAPLTILFKHALKNAFPPVLTVAGTTFGYLLSGSFVVETLFRIPGIGYASIEAIKARDYPVIQGLALLLAATFVLVNLIVDVLYGFLDPRARVGGSSVARATQTQQQGGA